MPGFLYLPAPYRLQGTPATITAVLMLVTVILGPSSGIAGLFA